MKAFKNLERVQIDRGPLEGLCGLVVRLRHADDGAWISLDERPEELAAHFPFPNTDDSRRTHVMVYPEDCVPAPVTV